MDPLTPMEFDEYARYLDRTEGVSVRWQLDTTRDNDEEQITQEVLTHTLRKKEKKTK
jgi:hypothetical protein